MGHPEGVTEWELDTHDPRCSALFSHRRHHGHCHSRDARRLDPPCQHGHVRAAVGSSRGENEAIGGLVPQVSHQLRRRFVPPICQAAVLKTHHGEMIRHCAADHAVASW
jgi:hypothetical protein